MDDGVKFHINQQLIPAPGTGRTGLPERYFHKVRFITTMTTRFIKLRNCRENNFSMVVAGDFCPREENCGDLIERLDEITAAVKPFFQSADIKLLQWECTVTRQDTPIDKSGPNHRCYPECAAFAPALGIDTVLLANNHTGDYGTPGIQDTLECFRKLDIRTVGAGMNEADAAEALQGKCNSVTYSIINAAEYEFGVAHGETAGIYAIDPIKLARQIKEEKAVSDIVFVALHGGHEQYSWPTPRLRSLCRFMVDCGANAVFNCHSHCPQGYELYNNVPIIYSPGNFYFPARKSSLPQWYIGYLPKFFFDADGVYALEILPYYNYKQALTLMDEADTEEFFNYLDQLSEAIADEHKLQKLFDSWSVYGGINGYFTCLFNQPMPNSFDDPDEVKPLLALRNLLTCQSHHDLLRNTALLMERGQLKNAGELHPLIESARHPQWVKIPETD